VRAQPKLSPAERTVSYGALATTTVIMAVMGFASGGFLGTIVGFVSLLLALLSTTAMSRGQAAPLDRFLYVILRRRR
jgi:hypothetical protein